MYLSELDVVFISYDEPNAEAHWADLLRKAPWAKRVHGVKGFDAAHKAAANEASTDFFITVDGDNIVKDGFLDTEIDDVEGGMVLSFASKNNINGLTYGNGGLKIWPTEYVKVMAFHEDSSDTQAVDFCWDDTYRQQNVLSSENFQNGSAYQSFRAGFREGVKMSLNRGARVKAENFLRTMDKDNLTRLRIWCSVGNDVDFGDWAIHGARLGAYKTICTDWNFGEIRDYDWFDAYFKTVQTEMSSHQAMKKLNDLVGLGVVDLDAAQSSFFKAI